MEENQNGGADDTAGKQETDSIFNTQSNDAQDTFLAAFYPDENEPICLRHFPAKDAPGKATAKNIQTTRQELLNNANVVFELQSLNAQRGIYFVVNAGGNKDADIMRFAACFAEKDNGTLEDQNKMLDAAPLQPSIRVETKKSIHAYWLINGDCTAKEWREVQRLLIEHFDGDTAIKNPARVMRLPGYNHVSYNQTSASYEYKAVEVTHADYARRYSISELRSAFTKPNADAPRKEQAEQLNATFLAPVATPENQETAKRCLPHLSLKRCKDYTGWLEVGIALCNVFAASEEGLGLWREWSRKTPDNFKDGACEATWETFNDQSAGGLAVGSLITWAREDSPDAFAEEAAAISIQNRQDDFTTRAGWLYCTGDGKNIRISKKLGIIAKGRDARNGEWGCLLEFSDPDGVVKRHILPDSMFAGDGTQYRATLLSMGLQIESSQTARNLLTRYIQNYDTPNRFRSVKKVGWYKKVFVLPDTAVGDSRNEQVIFQPEKMPDHRLSVSGTLAEWQQNIARYCVGNSRLAFAISAAFAGCLAPLLSQESGGFHLRSTSSTGKTTALLVAGSVWGGDPSNGYKNTWRATSNGLESVAELHNHGLLCLDEIGQADAKVVGDIAYMLANGGGKIRSTKTLAAQRQLTWVLIFLSSGEHSLAEVILSVGGRIKGGQEVRVIDIEADAGKGFGVLDNLHGFGSSSLLIDHSGKAALSFYGSPIRSFLEKLTSRDVSVVSEWNQYRDAFVSSVLQGQSSGEVVRVCTRFALVGFAGEQATALGVTGWESKTASDAAQGIFRAWLAGRGTTGVSDIENGIRAVVAFIATHGSSRFHAINQNADFIDDRVHVNNRAGFKRTKDGVTEYLILPDVFRGEVCKSYDSKAIAKELARRGMLRTQTGGGYTINERIPELSGQTRVYAIRLLDE